MQDVSGGRPLTAQHTLAVVTVQTELPVGVPAVGKVDFGSFRRLTPISQNWGLERGRPIDRYYIERFLAAHAQDIRGRVMEIKDPGYTNRFGGDRVTQVDILHAAEGNPLATIVGDLSRADHIPSDTFDCIILTQTLYLIYGVREAIQTLHRILKPGGVLLATFPGTSHKISRYDEWGDYWRFTSASAQRLFADVFPPERVTVESAGNVLTAVTFLHGLAVEELTEEELDHYDPDYEISVAVRAVKPAAT